MEYTHGGISLQEMVTPVLRITAGKAAGGSAQFMEAKWTGAKCRVLVGGDCAGVRVDVRTSQSGNVDIKAGAELIVAWSGDPDCADGKVTVFLEDDSDIGNQAEIVLLDSSGQVIASRSTTLGE